MSNRENKEGLRIDKRLGWAGEIFMRALWTGSLSIGLVRLPIKLFPATEERGGPEFTLLHGSDLAPIRMERVCSAEEKEVPAEEVVRGYEYRRGKYVTLTEEEVRGAQAGRVRTIRMDAFVRPEEVDPIYGEKSYWIEPGRGGEKAYVLLREALRKAERVGIGTFVLRGREHLAALRAVGDALMLEQLRFSSQLRDAGELRLPEQSIERRELEVAVELIHALTKPFRPEEYRDAFTEELREIIAAKAGGERPRRREGEEATEMTRMKDLLLTLRRSLEQTERRSPKTHARRRGESIAPAPKEPFDGTQGKRREEKGKTPKIEEE